ncbi:MAG: nucleotidyltransferase family protein [Clostridia bacterium]|nr:nucleotidyltransferase family protein [Clostridia bacterium]
MVNFIVCEFNPFHNGHAYLLQAAGNDPKICIMSSHVTQRGDFAFCDKWKRAEMALKCGADLVLELPAPFAMSQAPRFAAGAMAIAKATGLAGRIVFGCEGANKAALSALARIEEEQLSPLVKPLLKSGLPYAAAMSQAYETLVPEHAALLSTPNNLLGLEYVKAAPEFDFECVQRIGAAHDADEGAEGYCSASLLRREPERYPEFTPEPIHPIYQDVLENGLTPDTGKTDLLWLHALRSLSEEQWDKLAPDGVGRRLFKAAQTAATVEEALQKAKTRCCTYASLRRITLKALIGDCDVDTPPYLRVLGANRTGIRLLSEMEPSLPILTKPAAVSELDETAQKLMDYESKLTDTYMLLLKNGRQKGLEFLTSPVIL